MPYVTYPAVIDKDVAADGTPVYGITFPDFPGCVSVGESILAAIRRGEQALTGHIAAMRADGEALPEPTPLEEFNKQVATRGAEDGSVEIVHLQLITVAVPGAARRINVMLDETLIEEIDAVSHNRSAFLADAARQALARRR